MSTTSYNLIHIQKQRCLAVYRILSGKGVESSDFCPHFPFSHSQGVIAADH